MGTLLEQMTAFLLGEKTMRPSRPMLVSFALMLLVSCAKAYPPMGVVETGKPAYVAATPTTLTLEPGKVQAVHVTVKDAHKNPLPKVLVRVETNMPNIASVKPESAPTDDKGTAVFSVKGIAPAPAKVSITFTADSVLNTIEANLIIRQ